MGKARVRRIDQADPGIGDFSASAVANLAPKPRGPGKKFEKGHDPRRHVGRPRVAQPLAEQIREMGETGGLNARLITALAAKALRGDVSATRALWERGYGAPREVVDLTTHQGGGMAFEALCEATRDFFMERAPQLVDEYLQYISESTGGNE